MDAMPLSARTRIACTIGPASAKPEILEEFLRQGMSVARLNLAHGDFASHEDYVRLIRDASCKTGIRVAILADLPGPKYRVGRLLQDPMELRCEDDVVLSIGKEAKATGHIPVDVPGLAKAVRPGDAIFLSDGFLELRVKEVQEEDIICTVVVGGTLRSHKGINIPEIDLGAGAVTSYDHDCIAFAAQAGIDAISVSYVERPDDILEVRRIASSHGGYSPAVIAKIERRKAVQNLDALLEAADGIMVARGDLGVETPIEEIAIVQKRIIHAANRAGKPVITATQMLESMMENRRPTRAEVTDISNAILDGTDCVMLSEETAMGRYPVEAISMMARIATATERDRSERMAKEPFHPLADPKGGVSPKDIMASAVQVVAQRLHPLAIVVPTRSGTIARRLAKFRLPIGILAMCTEEKTCQRLQFTYGVTSQLIETFPPDWADFCRSWFKKRGITDGLVLLAQGPSSLRPQIPHRIDVVDLSVSP